MSYEEQAGLLYNVWWSWCEVFKMGSPYANVHGFYRGLGNGVCCIDFATLRAYRPRNHICAIPVCENNQMDNGRVI